ncbi:MAG: thiolase family protein, partial [Clostridia bacterium]|nr:thiolase family protein [Clostridia bacterium]
MSLRGKVAIVGIGEVPTGRFPDRSPLEAAVTVSREAIQDAGIDKSEIDYVIPTGHFAFRRFNTDLVFSILVEELGLGGTAKGNAQKTAGALINAGMARAVLCVHSEQLGTGLPVQEVIDLFSTLGIPAEWETPYGQHFSAVAGLFTTRYMFETGTTAEEIASVCVSNRKWAELNPNAMFRKPLT